MDKDWGLGIGDWDWGLEIGIGDWGLEVGIEDWDWVYGGCLMTMIIHYSMF